MSCFLLRTTSSISIKDIFSGGTGDECTDNRQGHVNAALVHLGVYAYLFVLFRACIVDATLAMHYPFQGNKKGGSFPLMTLL